MDFQKLKTTYLAERTQFVLMDNDGFTVESCDTLLRLNDIELSLYEIFPVLENLRQTLEQLTINDKEIVYPVVEHSQGEQNFIFDFVFQRINLKGQDFLLWIINDQTDMYMNIMQLRKRIRKHDKVRTQAELRVVR